MKSRWNNQVQSWKPNISSEDRIRAKKIMHFISEKADDTVDIVRVDSKEDDIINFTETVVTKDRYDTYVHKPCKHMKICLYSNVVLYTLSCDDGRLVVSVCKKDNSPLVIAIVDAKYLDKTDELEFTSDVLYVGKDAPYCQDEEDFLNMLESLYRIYEYVAYKIKNRSVIVSFHNEAVYEGTKNNNRHKKYTESCKGKIQCRRYIYIGNNQVEDKKGHHEIKCDKWSVAGHWRTYKSGKKIWIAPYNKGKNRCTHTPNEYVIKN